MGIIRNQGIKDSIISYLGVVIGAVNVLFIYPAFLTTEQLGLFQFLVSNAVVLSPIILLGASNLTIRYFPHFRDEHHNHRGLMSLLLLLPLAGALLLLGLGWLGLALSPILAQRFPEYQLFVDTRDPLIYRYLPYMIPLTLCMAYGMLLLNQSKNFLRFVIPSFLENLFIKIGSAIISVLLFYQIYQLHGFVIALLVLYGMGMIGQALYLAYWGEFKLQRLTYKPDKALLREMGVYGLYSILGSMGATMMMWLDKLMIPMLIDQKGMAALGIYTPMAYIGMVIDVPKRSLEKITAPLIVKAFNENDLGKIAELYHKTSLNQLLIGLLFFLGIWLNIDDVLRIMPNGSLYTSARLVVLYLGLSALIDMLTGNNSQIILYSSYFKVNLYILLVLVALNVVFNYLFVRVLGQNITGAALATLCAVGLFNVSKLLFIWRIWRMHPFSWTMLYAIGLAALVYLMVSLLPFPTHPWLGILVRSALITLSYCWLVWRFKLSEDVNDLLDVMWQKWLARKK